MKYVRLFIFVILFVLGCTFAFQNQKLILYPVSIHLDLWVIPEIKSIPMPLGGVILLSFMVGVGVAMVYFFIGELTLRKRVFQKKSRIRQLDKELQKVREQVLQDDEKEIVEEKTQKISEVSSSPVDETPDSSISSAGSRSKFKA